MASTGGVNTIARIQDLTLDHLAATGRPWTLVGQIPGAGDDDGDAAWTYRTCAVQTVRAIRAVGSTEVDAFLDETWGAWPLIKREGGAFAATVLVGRAASNDVCIPHTSVSKLHARIRIANDGVFLRDAGSSNGTIVNGAGLAGDEERLLLSGDLIRLGSCLFQVFEPAHLHRVVSGLRAPMTL